MFNKLFGKSNKAEKAFNRGIEQFSKNELSGAISSFNTAIQLNSKNAAYYFNRGSTYHKLGRDDNALEDFKQALSFVNSGDNDLLYEIYCGYGISYRQTDKLDDAIKSFSNAIKINPNEVMAYVNRGIIYGLKKEYDNSISDYSKVIALSPNWYGAYFNRAEHYNRLEKFQLAINDYESSIKLAPPNVNMESIKTKIEELKQLVNPQTPKSIIEDSDVSLKNQEDSSKSHIISLVVDLFKERGQRLHDNIRLGKITDWELALSADSGENIGLCVIKFAPENPSIVFTIAVKEDFFDEIENIANQYLFLGIGWENLSNEFKGGYKIKSFFISTNQL